MHIQSHVQASQQNVLTFYNGFDGYMRLSTITMEDGSTAIQLSDSDQCGNFRRCCVMKPVNKSELAPSTSILMLTYTGGFREVLW